MVKGATYYAKLDAGISLNGYTGIYRVSRRGEVIKMGNMIIGATYAEVSFSTEDLPLGEYSVVGLITFPDGFIQSVLHENMVLRE